MQETKSFGSNQVSSQRREHSILFFFSRTLLTRSIENLLTARCGLIPLGSLFAKSSVSAMVSSLWRYSASVERINASVLWHQHYIYIISLYAMTTGVSVYKPQRDETYLLTCVTNKDSNQPAHLRSLIRVFVVHMKTLCVLGDPKCAQ